MFVGVQVAFEGEGWMVRAIDKCYHCIYERVLWFFFSTFLVLY